MRQWLRDNGLTLALAGLFAASLVGHIGAGWTAENETRAEHLQAALTLTQYLASGEFLSSLFENWESEFLQMWVFVMLTAWLFQRGSPESNDPDKAARETRPAARSPWPARAGGWVRGLYAHSLGHALLVLFLASFVLHWINSARLADDQAVMHGQAPAGIVAHLASAEFWFESFQNWQSEFLSTAVLIVLAIFLREKGSPESKTVDAPNGKTGAS